MSANCTLKDGATVKGDVMMMQDKKDAKIKTMVKFPSWSTSKSYSLGIYEADGCTAAKLTTAKRKMKASLISKDTTIAALDASSFGGGLFDDSTFKIIGNRVAIHDTATTSEVGNLVGCCKMEKTPPKSGSSTLEKSTMLLGLALIVQIIGKME